MVNTVPVDKETSDFVFCLKDEEQNFKDAVEVAINLIKGIIKSASAQAKAYHTVINYIDNKRPKINNNGNKRENFFGTTSCEICSSRTTYDFTLGKGESAHVFCSNCEKDIKTKRDRLAEINENLAKLGSNETTNKNNKTLTLKNDKKRR